MRKIPIISAVLAVLAGLALTLVAAAQQPNQVGVTLTEYRVGMSSSSLPAGVPVKFTATNNGTMMHEVVLEKAGAVDEALEIDGREAEIDDIAAGQTKSATWTITEPGEYQLACHVPGHYEAGMVMRFTVAAARTAGQARVAAPLYGGQQSAGAGDPSQASRADAPSTLPQTGMPANPVLPWAAGAAVIVLAAGSVVAWNFTHRSGRE